MATCKRGFQPLKFQVEIVLPIRFSSLKFQKSHLGFWASAASHYIHALRRCFAQLSRRRRAISNALDNATIFQQRKLLTRGRRERKQSITRPLRTPADRVGACG